MTNKTNETTFLNQMMEEGLEALELLEENGDNLLSIVWLEKYGSIIDKKMGGDLDEVLKKACSPRGKR